MPTFAASSSSSSTSRSSSSLVSTSTSSSTSNGSLVLGEDLPLVLALLVDLSTAHTLALGRPNPAEGRPLARERAGWLARLLAALDAALEDDDDDDGSDDDGDGGGWRAVQAVVDGLVVELPTADGRGSNGRSLAPPSPALPVRFDPFTD